MRKGKRIIAATVCLGGLLFLPYTLCSANQQVEQLEKIMNDTIKTDVKAGKAVQKWQTEQDALIEEMRSLKVEIQWLELQNKKYTHYVSGNQRKIDELEETNSHYAVIELQLEAALYHYFTLLEQAVREDLPFLERERQTRLDFLRDTLESPELSIGEKFRRFSEALNVEAAYGVENKIEFQNVVLNGKTTEANVLRVGRIGFYALTLDRRESGIWDTKSQSFVRTTEAQHELICKLYSAISNKQFLQVISLPAGSSSHE